MGITEEAFRRKCEEKMQEGIAFIGIAYNEMQSFLFMYTADHTATVYHYSYTVEDRFGREKVFREETFDKHVFEAVQNNPRKYRNLVAWEETKTFKARKGDVAKLRSHIAKLKKNGKLSLLLEYDGENIVVE